MLLLGRIVDWIALIAVVMSSGLYLVAGRLPEPARRRWTFCGRIAFITAALAVIASVADLGTLLVTHRFDAEYVYEHSARATDPLYWFPAMWAGQEGSFLLWAFWTVILGVVLSATAGRAERRVMPIYNGVLIFLTAMLVIRSPFLPLDLQGGPVPLEGLGLNPNLENPWMVIHPPTLFLGLSSLAAPFAYALMALFWRDWDGWLRRALPWGLFGFATLGLAMMMGGYWAYEMLGWGGFWGWDPVENGPFIPWLGIIAFLHAAQVQRVRKGLIGTTLTFALLPFIAGLYETFLTRTGALEKFSVHSFSKLAGIGNDVLLYVLLGSLAIAIAMLIARRRQLRSEINVWEAPATREFGYVTAVLLVTLCGLISTIGMSAPLLAQLGQWLHWTKYEGSVPEDFYNRATYPVAVLLAIGMGIGPYLSWRVNGADTRRLLSFYGVSVVAIIAVTVVRMVYGSAIGGGQLVAQMILFTASVFALSANGYLLFTRLRGSKTAPEGAGAIAELKTRTATAGGVISHIGVAVLFLGIVCLVTFVRKDENILLVKGDARPVLGGAYTMTYLGQTGNFEVDRNNALKFAVASRDGREKFTALLPFALRGMEGGDKKIFGHPAIAHHAFGDLYLALKDGPVERYPTNVFHTTVPLGGAKQWGPYTFRLVRFERDPAAAAYILQTGQMPAVFPVTAVMDVTYQGKTTTVRPQNIRRLVNPLMPDSPEVSLPGGWLVSCESMNAGSADRSNPNGNPTAETASFMLRANGVPPAEGFWLDITTRPMINLVWMGTLLLVIGGLLSMRRRILENRATPDIEPDQPASRNVNVRKGAPSPSAKPRSRRTLVGSGKS